MSAEKKAYFNAFFFLKKWFQLFYFILQTTLDYNKTVKIFYILNVHLWDRHWYGSRIVTAADHHDVVIGVCLGLTLAPKTTLFLQKWRL